MTRGAGLMLRKTGLDAEPHQLLDIADVQAFFEVSLHDPFRDFALQAMASRVRNQQMGPPRVRQPLDEIEPKLQADRLALPHQRRLTVGEVGRTAGLGREGRCARRLPKASRG